MTRDLQAICKRVAERIEAEQELAQRSAADARDSDELDADLAADLDDDPAAKEAALKAIQQQVEDTLQEDAEAVGAEPARHVTAIHPAQVRLRGKWLCLSLCCVSRCMGHKAVIC
jgi:phosphopantetheinyl transferase (holo-ACP synthase)